MTTSGVTTYLVSRNDIITAALQDLRVLAVSELPTPEMLTQANRALNQMIKAWQSRAVGLWLNQAVTINPVIGQQSYYFGPLGATGNTVRPLEFIELRVADSSGSETTIDIVSRQEYMGLSLKSNSGIPNMAFYDPQLVNGVLSIWPTFSDLTHTLEGTMKVPIQTFQNMNDTPDFPMEWFEAIEYNLAKRLMSKFDCPPDKRQEIMALAQEFLTDAEDFDRERVTVRFAYRSR
jgi:hypothetical protein